jgi:putative ABC transport system permease protein
MSFSHLKIFLRNSIRQLPFTLLNIGGLSLGIAASFVILLYVIQETSYEKHFEGYQNVYRIGTKFMTMGEFANGPEVLLEVAPQEYSWIEDHCRVKGIELEFKLDQTSFAEAGLFVEPSFFEIFPYSFELGSLSSALANSNSIVLNKDLAITLFGDNDPINKFVFVGEDNYPLLVTGVIDTENTRSHLEAPFWTNNEIGGNMVTSDFDDNWLSVEYYNYIKVTEGKAPGIIQEALDDLVRDRMFLNMGSTLSFEDWFARDDSYHLILQPLKDVYLKGTLRFDLSEGGNEATVKTLLAIAFLIIFIAIVNFINLTTARTANRGKEIGVKKVMGTSRRRLAWQFTLESIVFSLSAVIFSIGLAEIGLILFERITGQALLDSPLLSPFNLLIIFTLAVSVGFLAGIYPAFYLTSHNPSSVLKGDFHSIRTNVGFRNILVVFQFSLSIILIISSILMFRQLGHMRTMDKGFDQSDVLIIDNTRLLGDKTHTFKDLLSSHTEIEKVAIANRFPGSSSSYSMTTLKSDFIDEPVRVNRFRGDHKFLDVLGFELLEGRKFSDEIFSDSNAVILSESAVKELQLKDPIGAALNDDQTVIGVVRDFNFETLRKQVSPAVITLGEDWGRVAVKLNTQNARRVLSTIEAEWDKILPDVPLNYHFLDENFENLMKNENKMAQVVTIFTVLAILISCLGLFGLSAYVVSQRKKEIGIRKLMGASVLRILFMLNINYSKLIVLAALFAIPVSIYIMNSWLSEFAYRISISSGIILWAVVITGMVAIVSVSFQSISAATLNPVDSLKEE